VDPIVIVIVIAVGMPLAVIWALARSSRLRGPSLRRESRRPVGALVTDAVPEEHRDPDDDREPGPTFSIDSEAPEPDPSLWRPSGPTD
jgi:hypothetical protein